MTSQAVYPSQKKNKNNINESSWLYREHHNFQPIIGDYMTSWLKMPALLWSLTNVKLTTSLNSASSSVRWSCSIAYFSKERRVKSLGASYISGKRWTARWKGQEASGCPHVMRALSTARRTPRTFGEQVVLKFARTLETEDS